MKENQPGDSAANPEGKTKRKYTRRPKNSEVVVSHIEPSKAPSHVNVSCPDPTSRYESLTVKIPPDLGELLLDEKKTIGFEVTFSEIIVAAISLYFTFDEQTRAKTIVEREEIYKAIICPYIEAKDFDMIRKLMFLKEGVVAGQIYNPTKTEGES